MKTNELKTCDGKELLEMKFPDREDCVKDFIPQGIGLFGGRPYSGKLRILLDICASIALGAPLWGMETKRGDVLYIVRGKTLRDMQRLMKSIHAEGIGNLYFADETEKSPDGLRAQIGDFIDRHPDTRLVVIDPMMGWTGYNAGDEVITTLEWVRQMKLFADERGISILLVKNTKNKRIGSSLDCSFGMEESVASTDFTMFFSCYQLSPITGTLAVAINGCQERNLRFTLDWETGRWVFKSKTPLIEEWRGCTK